MRRVLLPALLAATAWSGGPAAAVDAGDAQRPKQRSEQRAETIDGLVRIVGAQAGIVLYCRKPYTVDDAVSEGLSRTVRRALDEAIGRQKAQVAVAEEGQRFASEIATVATSSGAPTSATS